MRPKLLKVIDNKWTDTDRHYKYRPRKNPGICGSFFSTSITAVDAVGTFASFHDGP